MALTKIIAAVKSFLSSVDALVITFTGKSTIKKFEDYADQIVDKINEALTLPTYAAQARTYESDYNDFIIELNEAKTDFSQWETAKSNYDTTNATLAGYQAKLALAKTINNSADIEKYTTLISRATRSLSRRKRIMDRRWNDFITSTGQIITAFVPLWNGYEILRGYLP